MDDAKLLAQFVAEANEHLARIEQHLVELERNPADVEHVHQIFQGIHSIKGTSDYVALVSVNRLSHEMETLLNRVRRGELSIRPELIDLLLAGVDLLKDGVANTGVPDHRSSDVDALIERLATVIARPASRPRASTPAVDPQLYEVFRTTAAQHLDAMRMIQTDAEQGNVKQASLAVLRRTLKTFRNSANYLALDTVVDSLTAAREWLGERKTLGTDDAPALAGVISELASLIETPVHAPQAETPAAPVLPEPDVTSPRGSEEKTLRVAMRKLDGFMNQVSDLVLIRNALTHLAEVVRGEDVSADFAHRLQSTSRQLAKTSSTLQDQVMSIRLVPIAQLFDRYPRMVRDLCRSHGKEARLQVLGGDTEVDAGVADLLADPLLHLIRNAIAHGLETREERAEAGKSDGGTITLKAAHEGSSISVEVIDDGRGIDPQAVAEAAARSGLVETAAAREMSDGELVDLLFRPGFSTVGEADGLSGRGVGLDAVRTNVQRIGGNVNVHWEAGQGTRFRVKIPLTLAVIHTLVVEAGGRRYAVPTSFVEENLRLSDDRITRLNNVRTMIYKDEAVPLLRLRDLLGLEGEAEESSELTTVVIHHGARRYGILVDRIVVQQDALVRPLDAELGKLRQFAGATVTNDGQLILILNPAGLVQARTERFA